MPSWASLPRGAVIVTDRPDIGARARAQGRTAIVVGVDCAAEELIGAWSDLAHRSPAAWVGGHDPALAPVVNAACQRAAMNTGTGAARSRAWVRHMLANVAHLASTPPAQALSGHWAGVPCFVAGAGPSLSETLSELILARARGIVISVNAASRCVDAQCVLTLEANDLSHKIDPKSAVRLYSLGAQPESLSSGAGPLLPFWSGEASRPVTTLTRTPPVASSISGTTAAVTLAQMWGCDPIVLCGQDLAFTGGRVYAAATGFTDRVDPSGRYRWSRRSKAAPRLAALPAATELEECVSWDGTGVVWGNGAFAAVAEWLTHAAQLIRARCVNATGGGRRIAGWESVPLADVVAALPERRITPRDIHAAAGEPVLSRDQLRAWLETVAPDALLEPYAHADTLDVMNPYRAAPQRRLRFLEARDARRTLTELEHAAATRRAELEQLCLYQASLI